MIERISPLDMGLEPERTLFRNGWQIPLTYVGERTRSDLFITDLSHVPKWCIHGRNLDNQEPCGVKMPRGLGAMTMDRGILLVRLHSSEARILLLGDEELTFKEPSHTDITDAYAAMALVGPQCFDLLSKLSTVDMDGPAALPAALAPIEDLTCLLVRLTGQDDTPGLIITSARGYGHFLLDAIMDAGKEYGIQPAGWHRFGNWLGNARKAA